MLRRREEITEKEKKMMEVESGEMCLSAKKCESWAATRSEERSCFAWNIQKESILPRL